MSDTDAIEAVKRGDKDRYAELVARYQTMVYGVVWSRLGDPFLCQDAAQETFIKAYRYLAGLRNPDKFPAWLARIARNVSVSMLRTRRRELDARRRWELEPAAGTYDRSDPSDVSERPASDRGDSLRASLQELSPNDRESLVLFYLEGKSIHESAALLDISEGAMKTRLYRARQALRGLLDEHLEESLERLRPPKDFSRRVMALLPSMPWCMGIGVGVGAAKPFGWLAGSLFGFILPVALNAAMFRWYVKLEHDNLKAGPGHELRRRAAASSAIAKLLLLAATFPLVFYGLSLGLQQFYIVLTFLTLVPVYRVTRNLRVNQTPFMWGQAMFCYGMLLTVFSIAFLNAPPWTFFALMVIMTPVFASTNRGMPARHDYNLFARYILGTLGDFVNAVSRDRSYTRTELVSFARFLGSRFLTEDVSFRESGMTLALPPVRRSVRYYLGLLDSKSRLRIGYDGRIEAFPGRQDARDLQRLPRGTRYDLSHAAQSVEHAVRTSLHHFLQGDLVSAEHAIQKQSDAEIFKSKPGRSRQHWVQVTMGTLAAVALLGMGVYASFLPGMSHVTREQALNAFNAWCTEVEPNVDLSLFLHDAPIRPPLAFFDDRGRQNYLGMVVQDFQRFQEGNNTPLRDALFVAKPLYHAIDGNLLTEAERDRFGFTEAAFRDALSHGGGAWINDWTRKYFNLEDEAYRVAMLAHFDCLEFLDEASLVDVVAATQVLDGWQPTEYTAELDTTWAHGLFAHLVFPLQDTRAALWILKTLNRLDAIDREACIDGIMRFYEGKGKFTTFSLWRDINVPVYGREEDAYYAMESLHILNALDRIEDLDEWHFEAVTIGGDVTCNTLLSFAFQYRLNELRHELARRE